MLAIQSKSIENSPNKTLEIALEKCSLRNREDVSKSVEEKILSCENRRDISSTLAARPCVAMGCDFSYNTVMPDYMADHAVF